MIAELGPERLPNNPETPTVGRFAALWKGKKAKSQKQDADALLNAGVYLPEDPE